MPFYRVKHKATGRTEIVEAGDRRTARNAIALEAFEVELATAEDGFRLAKEGREIIVAGTVKDPDQPTLPLEPLGDPSVTVRGGSMTMSEDWSGTKELRDKLLALGLDVPEREIEGWRVYDVESVRIYLNDECAPGTFPTVLGPYLDAQKKAPPGDDARLLAAALQALEINPTEAVVLGWTDEERAAAWDFVNASAVAGDMGGPDLPDFLRVYTSAGLAVPRGAA